MQLDRVRLVYFGCVPGKVWLEATRWAAVSEPVNKQFFLLSALGLMAFLTELLSIELHPAQGCNRH